MKIDGTLQRIIPIITPGSVLSQPPKPISASYARPWTTASIESAISSRENSENFIPSWFMLMPSETDTVVNSRGVPPASAMPSFAASTWKSCVILQGVCSPFILTTPTIGFASAASSKPIARMKARWGARSRPSVVTRDRNFFIATILRAGSSLTQGRSRVALLLQRRHNGRMLELRHIQLRKHPRLGVDVEHLLDRGEVWRGTRVAAEIVVLEEVRIEHRNRRLQYLGNDLQCFLTVGQRLLHARGDIAHISLDEFRILVDELGAAGLKNVDDVRHGLRERKQLSGTALRLGARREGLIHVDGIDTSLTQGVLGNRKANFDQLDIFGWIHAGLLQQHVEGTLGTAADYGDADGLAFEIGDGLDGRFIHHRPVDREAAGFLEHVLCHDVRLQISADNAVGERQRRLGRTIQRAGGECLRHRRGALELRPLDIVSLAEVRKFLRPAHHPIFRLLGRNGPADANRPLRLRGTGSHAKGSRNAGRQNPLRNRTHLAHSPVLATTSSSLAMAGTNCFMAQIVRQAMGRVARDGTSQTDCGRAGDGNTLRAKAPEAHRKRCYV